MKHILLSAVMAIAALLALPAQAASPAGEQYIRMMVNGGPGSIRDAAKGIYNTNMTEREVLDVLAEVMLRDYKKPDRTAQDAVAWGCRALGQIGDARYRPVLEEIQKNAPRKLSNYAEKALDSLPKGASAQPYKPGSVSIEKLRNKAASGSKGSAAPAASSRGTAASSAGKSRGKFGDIVNGMTTDEVIALLGPPTSETSHITGKQFRPFNYRGADTVRVIYLYKGQGRIVFTNSSHYTSIWRVMEVMPDPNEAGYP